MQLVNLMDYSMEVEHQTIWIKNHNTTIAYCRYSNDGDIEYIYAQPIYLLMGFGRKLVEEVQRTKGKVGLPHESVSPMRQRFFAALEKYS